MTVVMSASWGRTTPLGTPVEPEVYIMMAGSFMVGFTATALEEKKMRSESAADVKMEIPVLALSLKSGILSSRPFSDGLNLLGSGECHLRAIKE